jgi:hypothetical protein
MKKYLALLLVAGILICISTGCKKKKGDPPALPAIDEITIDLSYFDNSKSGSKGVEDNYFEIASVIVNTWRPIVEQSLSVPIAACEHLASLSVGDAKWVTKNTWEWKFTSSGKAVNVTAVIGSSVAWTVTIDSFEWATGTSNTAGTSGTWNIKESSVITSELLRIDWAVSGTSITSIKYTCSSGNYNGSHMTYTPTATGADYSASLNGSHNSAPYSVEWNATSGVGRIKCQSEFGDSDWRAWNANKENI